MKAVVIESFGGPDVLQVLDVEEPRPPAGHVIVRVRAAALNYSDLLQRRGTYSNGTRLGSVLGMECSGSIETVGAGVSGWEVGARVCALVSEGAYAEKVSVPVSQLMRVPPNIEWTHAAALPEALATVWSNVLDIGRLAPGESILVHGGSGGIGSTAIQVAAARGAKVFATAGDDAKLARCRELGAHRAIGYRDEDFVEVVRNETAGRGVDLILDNMGASYLARNVDALAHDGRIVTIGLQGGHEATAPLGKMMGKRASLFTTSLRDRPDTAKARIVEGVVRDLMPWVADGRVRPIVDRAFSLDATADAHRYMETGTHFGKVLVVTPTP